MDAILASPWEWALMPMSDDEARISTLRMWILDRQISGKVLSI